MAWDGLGWLGVAWGGLGWLRVAWRHCMRPHGVRYAVCPNTCTRTHTPQLLLGKSASVNAADASGYTALTLALQQEAVPDSLVLLLIGACLCMWVWVWMWMQNLRRTHRTHTSGSDPRLAACRCTRGQPGC